MNESRYWIMRAGLRLCPVKVVTKRSPGYFDEAFIGDLVAGLIAECEGAPVQDFVEVLVIKEAIDELRRLTTSDPSPRSIVPIRAPHAMGFRATLCPRCLSSTNRRRSRLVGAGSTQGSTLLAHEFPESIGLGVSTMADSASPIEVFRCPRVGGPIAARD